MLGIRHYKNTAIDLWMGDHKTFACDTLITIEERLTAEYFRCAEERAGRHLVFAVPAELLPGCVPLMRDLKQTLDAGLLGKQVKRVTFAVSEGELYDALQTALFSTFSETL